MGERTSGIVDKYDGLVARAKFLERTESEEALSLYKDAEYILPNTLTEDITRVKAKIKAVSEKLPPINSLGPVPRYMMESKRSSIPDFSFVSPPRAFTSPFALVSSSNLPPSPIMECSDEEFGIFLDQLIDFCQVMPQDDIDDMVTRRDYQLISYLVTCSIPRPPSNDNIPLALKTAQAFMSAFESVPASHAPIINNKVVTWIVRWCKFFIAKKIQDAKEENYDTEKDDIITFFMQLLSVICGQHQSLSPEEKELLDEQSFITTMIQFLTEQWEYNESSGVSYATALCLCGISSQFGTPEQDPIVFALYGIAEAATLGRFFIHVINQGAEPRWLQAAALSTARKLFDFSLDQKRECYFFTNDVHVLLDIILREIMNLEEFESELRMSYLGLLKSIIKNHEYIEKGKHKAGEVAELLAIIQNQDFDTKASEYATQMFGEYF